MASIVKRSNGELLVKEIHDAMWEQKLTATQVAKKAKVSRTTFYRYMRYPGNAPVADLLRICRAVGMQQVTLITGGTYYDK